MGKKEFFAFRQIQAAQMGKMIGFFAEQSIFFFTIGSRQSNEWNRRLNCTSPFDDFSHFAGNAHRPTGERSKCIDAAASIGLEGWAIQIGKSLGQLIDVTVRPLIDEPGSRQSRSCSFHHFDLRSRSLENGSALCRLQGAEPSLNFVPIQHGDREDTSATVRTSLGAGDLIKQSSLGSLKPKGRFFKKPW